VPRNESREQALLQEDRVRGGPPVRVLYPCVSVVASLLGNHGRRRGIGLCTGAFVGDVILAFGHVHGYNGKNLLVFQRAEAQEWGR